MNAPALASSNLVVTLTVDALRELLSAAVEEALARHEADRASPAVLVRAEEMARRLGVSRATVHRLRHEGCPTVKLGDTFKYEPAAVVAWLRERPKARAV